MTCSEDNDVIPTPNCVYMSTCMSSLRSRINLYRCSK